MGKTDDADESAFPLTHGMLHVAYTTRVSSTLEYVRDQQTDTCTNVKSEINRKLITNLIFFPRLTREELM